MNRLGLGVLGLLVVAVAISSAYESMMRRRVVRTYPAPGRLVKVGEHGIQLDCRGQGTPVVVFEAGLDDLGSLSWAAVHDSVAATTRACAYSRAGIMWSDPVTRQFSPRRVADDLHAALAAANEPGPYVLVGHSLGGPYIMTFVGAYGADVAGVVFVDASHPDQQERLRKATGKDLNQAPTIASIASALSWTGIVRMALPNTVPDKAPKFVAAEGNAFAPTSLAAVLAELKGIDSTFIIAGRTRTLGDRPLVVLTSTQTVDSAARTAMGISSDQGAKLKAEWVAMHDDEASWSIHSRHQLVPDASHYIQFDRPDIVIAAVREVVSQLRPAPAIPATPPLPTPTAP